jgi:hypothetical protein
MKRAFHARQVPVSATPVGGYLKRYSRIGGRSGMVAWHIIVLTVIDISIICSAILERQSKHSRADLS